MKKGVPFPTVSGNPKLSKDFQKKTSAFSASSRFTLFFSCRRIRGKSLVPKRRKGPQTAEIREHAEGTKDS
jgi:hypothetical protein